MSQGSVKAFSTIQVQVPKDNYISVRTQGNTEVRCSYVLESSEFQDAGQVVGVFANNEKTFSFKDDVIFTIAANADPVYYQVKTSSPSAIDLVPLSMATAHSLVDDFDSFQVSSWTVTKTEPSAAPTNDVAEDGGILKLANSEAVDDVLSLQKNYASFTGEPNKKVFYEARLKVNNSISTGFAVGMLAVTSTPFTASSGLYFRKLAGTSMVSAVAVAAAVETTVQLESIGSGWFTVGYAWDGLSDEISILFNGLSVASLPAAATPVNILLTPTFAVINGASSSGELDIDYYQVVKAR
jgi:hypothetical protein